MRAGERGLRIKYRQAIRLFSELRQGEARTGEARESASHLLREFRAEETRRTIESALNLSSAAHSTRSAAKATRRSWWLAVVATAVAVLVSLAPLQDLVSYGRSARDELPKWIGAALDLLAEQPLIAALQVVASILALSLALWFVTWLGRSGPRALPSLTRGFSWPVHIRVSEASREEAEELRRASNSMHSSTDEESPQP
ncbi:hypothetical protein GCM10025874_03120 [Arenivirga flava]|uniref:Uncharacterized protein n=1 Tax=Arenivirga flava TaxID=1930060 RepID=A0AA37X831_9MICO|nr:hypothetical protein GCM10025874_03120 [Arenivirga flava]